MNRHLRLSCCLFVIFSSVLSLKASGQALPTPEPYEVETQWSHRQLEKIIQLKNESYTQPYLTLHLAPAQISYYVALQKQIAWQYPEELDRPTIEVIIQVKKHTTQADCLAILGGTGPLADASLIRNLVRQLSRQPDFNWDKTSIRLLSMPPPRKLAHVFYGIQYFYNLFRFGELPLIGSGDFERLAVASNTAHMYSTAIKSFLFSFSEFIDLANHNAVRLSLQSPTHVLIVGTQQAARSRLYQTYMESLDVSFSMPSNQTVYQHFIEQIKKGQEVSPVQFTQAVLEDASQISKKESPISHVFLACTELSQAVDTSALSLFQKSKITVVDSLEMITQRLVKEVLAVQKGI